MKSKLGEDCLNKIEEKIGYTFNNKSNIGLALTHSSYANEKKNRNLQSNERIEFLGDSVLNLIVSDHLYNNYEELSEGELTKMRASIVCEQTLSDCAKKLDLGDYVLLGKGEELSGGRSRNALLCDLFESIIGVVYLDGGFEPARKFVYKSLEKAFNDARDGRLFTDYKTALQETAQKKGDTHIRYKIVNESGPDHDKTYFSQVSINKSIKGKGAGKSKKEAEQNAAKEALKTIS